MNKNDYNSSESTATFNISSLQKCIEEVKESMIAYRSDEIDTPKDYNNLLARLEKSKDSLPNVYIEAVYNPFKAYLQYIGEQKYMNILKEDKNLEGLGGLILDVAQSILQRGEGYNKKSTQAFQAIVSDLYEGFLSCEDREGVKEPDKGIVAPLIKWGNPQMGPYTWTADSTEEVMGVRAAIVSLPPSHAKGCLLGWSALGHETGGHDILHADVGLLSELKVSVETELKSNGMNILANYIGDRIDEVASDVLGILNMGPAAGIGLIGYFCGMNLCFYGKATLGNVDPGDGAHPVDILRGYLAAEAVKLLKFSKANEYGEILKKETDKYLHKISLDNNQIIDKDLVCEGCKITADVIMNKKLKSLENHSLGEIQNWHDDDEAISNELRQYISGAKEIQATIDSNVYATHVVAASIYEAISDKSNIKINFDKMKEILALIYNSRHIWATSPLKDLDVLTKGAENKLERIRVFPR